MLALRYVGLLAVAVWIGGLLALGAIAAPAIFDVIALRSVPDGRMLSGAIVGEALRRFHLVAYGCGAVVLASLAARALLGPRPRRFAIRFGIAALMLSAALYSGVVVSGSIERLQREIGAAPSPLGPFGELRVDGEPGRTVGSARGDPERVEGSSLPESDPRRAAFGLLHGQSTLLQIVPLLGGLVLMFWDLRD